MGKAALVVGINYYENQSNLSGCVNDAKKIDSLLAEHANEEQNFETRCLVADSQTDAISSTDLLAEIKSLFENQHNNIALLYFSGHGGITSENAGYLATSDTMQSDSGILMKDIIEIVNASPVANKIIILDTCHSGDMGNHPSYKNVGSCIGEGVTILTASSQEQVALENDEAFNRHGIFTQLLIDALNGGSASIIGQITLGSIYAHIDKALGNFGQRPIFKTNTNRFIVIRKFEPQVKLSELRALNTIFTDPNIEYSLDQTYELDKDVPDTYANKKPCIPEHNKIFRILQNLNRVNIINPVGTKDMYYAAMNEKACELTALGKFYWELAKNKKL